MNSYLSIAHRSEGIYKEKGSKFIAIAFPVANEEEVKEALKQVRIEHPSARHHCYAYKINPEQTQIRANDDGEPSSTAGKPILGQIESFGLINVLICVVRYFGGTLLGASGLIRAYRNGAKDALENAEIVSRNVNKTLQVNVKYELLGEWMKIIKDQNWNYTKLEIGENCRFDVEIPLNDLLLFKNKEEELSSK